MTKILCPLYHTFLTCLQVLVIICSSFLHNFNSNSLWRCWIPYMLLSTLNFSDSNMKANDNSILLPLIALLISFCILLVQVQMALNILSINLYFSSVKCFLCQEPSKCFRTESGFASLPYSQYGISNIVVFEIRLILTLS